MLGTLRKGFSGLLGVNQDYNISAPTIDTKAGTAAIQGQAAQQTERARAQGYSLAASARGSSSPLALREAQRRAGMAQTQIANDAMIQQRQLEQAAAMQNANNQMRAAEANAAAQARSDAAWLGMVGTIGGGIVGGMAGGPAGAYVGSQAGGQLAQSDVNSKTEILPAPGSPGLPRPNPYGGSFPGVQPQVPRYEPAYAPQPAPDVGFLGPKYGSQMAGHDDGRRVQWAGPPPSARVTTSPQLAAESARVAEHARASGVELGASDWGAMGYQPPGTPGQMPPIRPSGGMYAPTVEPQRAGPPMQGPPPLPPVGSQLHGGTYLGDIDQVAPGTPHPQQLGNWGMPVSDARAKSLENENKALRDVIKDRAIDFALDTARDVSAPPGSPTLRRGSAGVAAMARRKFTPDVVEAFAGGREGTYSAPLSPAEQARLDRLAAGGVRTPRQVAVAAPAPPVVPGPPSLAAALPMPTQPVSDENAKDVLAALRQRAAEGEPGSETAAFLQRARERLNENQEKRLDHALLSAGLDRVEREATVDGGAPRLQAGRTNVARFDDVPPTVQAVAQTPNYQWRYKDGFAAEANARAGLPPTAPQGYARRTGPMAQDLEKSPVYSPAVVTGPDGMKRVDSGTVTMANAGVLSDLSRFAQEQEERIRRLEAGRSRVPYPKPREAGL